MGLFSRTRTQVGTQVSRVIEDQVLPNSMITGNLKASIESDGQIMEHTIEELSGGLGVRLHQYYRYGRDHYSNGLPSGTSMTNLKGKATIIAAIQAQVGAGIALDYYHVGALNLMHMAWSTMVSTYGYDSSDNSFTYGGRKVFLTDMQPVVKDATTAELDAGIMDRWGVSPLAGVTPERSFSGANTQPEHLFIVNAGAPNDYVLVDYCYETTVIQQVEGIDVPKKVITKDQFTFDLASVDLQATYHQARYSLNGKDGYWTYKVGSNVSPAVEAVFDTAPTANGTFFPLAYVRLNKATIGATSPDYASTKKLMKTINMDFDDISQSINDNPDIKDVEQAFLTVAVPAVTENELERRYLFDFFDHLYQSSSMTESVTKSAEEFDFFKLMAQPKQAGAIVIQDQKFKMALNWSTITKRRVAGKVADVGKHHSGTNFKVDEKTAITILGMEISWATEVPTHIYRRQLTETMYEEILVRDLSMTYHIFNEYTTTGDEQNENILLIPLDYAITSEYSIPDRETLYARALHFVFNSRVVTKLKWYQTGIFRVVLIIAAIVITVLTYGETFEAIGAALAAGEIAAALILLIPILVQFLVVPMIFRKVAKLIGAKWAIIIAIAAALASGYINYTEGVAGAPLAKDLLTLSSGLANGAGKQLQDDYREVMDQYRTFQEFVKEQENKVKTAEELLNNNVHLVPIVIFGETPDDFYQRTVHSGNIGMVGIEAVSSYVDVALTLPKISETIGEVYV